MIARFLERFGAALWVGLAGGLAVVWPSASTHLHHGVTLGVWLLVLAGALAANARLSLKRRAGNDV